MRDVSAIWGSLNASKSRERRFYFKVETDPGNPANDVYILSHSDVVPISDTAASDFNGAISETAISDLGEAVVTGTESYWPFPGRVLLARPKSHPKIRTQTLNPDEGRATIGTMNFDAIDISLSLTDEMRDALLDDGIGWRQKRVQYFSGFRQIHPYDYELEDTQLVDRITYAQGAYSFRCRDIQREIRKRIFEPVVLRLAQPVEIGDTTIELAFNTGLVALQHGAGWSDAPNQSVAYVQIDDEIIRVPAAGIGLTQLVGVARGVLGTRAAAHTTDENSSRGKDVSEVVYLELPVPKLVYALLTGNLIGQTGTLPDHWHLGINAGSFVRLSEFQNIGSDLYVQADDTLGAVERYILTEAEDGKQFIEKEILRKYGLFMPIHADGSIGLRRAQPVLSGSAVDGVIDDSMIVDEISLAYAMDKVINEIRIGWNEIDGEPSRYLNILDSDSVARWGTSPRLEVIARGLVGSKQTDSRVRDIFEGLRDRYSGPPLICSAEVHSSQSLYEVGDVVRLKTSTVRDFTNTETKLLDRAFEIQGVTKNLSAGTVNYSLFGSSQRAGALPPLESTAALPDAFYEVGTNIAGMAGVVDSGPELVLPDGIEFVGASTVGGAIYYALKDVRVPSSMTASYTQNVQLRIRGVLQIDGDLNGVGAGIPGVADTASTAEIPNFPSPAQSVSPIAWATQPGTPGYFGTTQAAGALIERASLRNDSTSKYRVALQSVPATITQGQVGSIPSLNIGIVDGAIVGIPPDLRGTSGGPGGLRYWKATNGGTTNVNAGGTGGAGGAGLLIISRGVVFGASGRSVSSGANGSAGVRDGANERPAWSGGGAGGAPGATLILLDGSSSPSPVLTSGRIIADYGLTPGPGDPHNFMPDSWFVHQETRFSDDPEVNKAFAKENRVSFFRSGSSGVQAGIAAARFFFLLPPVVAEDDLQDVALAGDQVITFAVTEAFDAVDDTKRTVVIIVVTEVSTTAAYSHANIYSRRVTGDDIDPEWVFQGGADPRLRVTLPADGEQYTFRAVPVLINGIEAIQGPQEPTTVSEPGLGFAAELVTSSGETTFVFNYDGTNFQPQRTEHIRYTYNAGGTYTYQNGSASADADRAFPWIDVPVEFYRGNVLIKRMVFRHICNYGREDMSGRIGTRARSIWISSTGTELDSAFTVQIGAQTGRVKWSGDIYDSTHDIYLDAEYGGSLSEYLITVRHTATGAEATQLISISAITAVAPFYDFGGGGGGYK